MPLTKADIVDTVSRDLGFPKNQCIGLVETLLEIVKITLVSDQDVVISGFGKCSGKLRDRINGGRSSGLQEKIH